MNKKQHRTAQVCFPGAMKDRESPVQYEAEQNREEQDEGIFTVF